MLMNGDCFLTMIHRWNFVDIIEDIAYLATQPQHGNKNVSPSQYEGRILYIFSFCVSV